MHQNIGAAPICRGLSSPRSTGAVEFDSGAWHRYCVVWVPLLVEDDLPVTKLSDLISSARMSPRGLIVNSLSG